MKIFIFLFLPFMAFCQNKRDSIITEIKLENDDFNLYPNPFESFIMVSSKNKDLIITNADGKNIIKHSDEKGFVDLTDLMVGIYFVERTRIIKR